MSSPSISIERLSKRYIITHQARKSDGLRHVLEQVFRNPWASLRDAIERRSASCEEFWALRDVSLEINQGDVVGVIGRNGAGKSTLLKIVSRITEPTSGRIRLRGRVVSLLEIGTGFHPDLTGRENIFLNGAILGMASSEIRRKFDEIVAFADVEKFVDTPVKRYSSGMYVRLAFAVAAHLEADILLVDEVLAVGDVEFQQKCLEKMQEVAAQTGRTILFVSHNMGSITRLCPQSLLLERGQVAAHGATRRVIEKYLEVGARSGEQVWREEREAPQTQDFRLRAVRVLAGANVSGEVSIDEPITIELECEVLRADVQINFGLVLRNSTGIEVFGSVNFPSASIEPDPWSGRRFPTGVFRTSCTLPANLLNDGRYSVSVFAVNVPDQREIVCGDVVTFHAHDTGRMRAEYGGIWTGVVRPRLHWRTRRVEAREEALAVGTPT